MHVFVHFMTCPKRLHRHDAQPSFAVQDSRGPAVPTHADGVSMVLASIGDLNWSLPHAASMVAANRTMDPAIFTTSLRVLHRASPRQLRDQESSSVYPGAGGWPPGAS